MKPTILKSNDPLRNEVLGLVRRQLSAGNFTKEDVQKWKAELGADVVDELTQAFAPKKVAKKANSQGSAAPEKKE